MGARELPGEVLIREPQSADAAALARLITQLGYPTDAAAIPARLERLALDANARALVAIARENVVGLATVHLRDTLNHHAPIAQLTLLVVDDACRAHGVGRALVEAAEDFARGRGAKRINVTSALDRAGAHAFYEAIGYRLTGRRYGRDFD